MKGRSFTLLLAAMVMVTVVAIVFNQCQERKANAIVPVAIQAQIDTVKSNEFKLQPKIDSLFTENGKLHEKDSINRKSLSFFQAEVKRLAKLAEAHIDSMGLYEPPDSNDNDYAGNIKELIANCAASDSVANETISNLNKALENTAKIIAAKDSSYKLLHNSFDIGIAEQKKDKKYIFTLQKQSKNRGTVNLILGGIGIVLAGILIVK